ncbi:hypothetical protein LEP3755_48330 [Leptolyngbya sp. NIES-3755]|nr:hypothetical protein LEP3755_48330 [Leptolyngbya sp. NIES-3755]
MSLNLPLKWQIPALSLIFAATCLPSAIVLYRKSNAETQQRNAIERQQSEQSEEIRVALDRATKCIRIDERYPLVDGARAFYDATGRTSKRLLPTGTTLCSRSGHTAIVDATGAISDIKQAPIEQINRILNNRGL